MDLFLLHPDCFPMVPRPGGAPPLSWGQGSQQPKEYLFGWNVGGTHEYAEIFALQEGVGYKNMISNPNGGYVGNRYGESFLPLADGKRCLCLNVRSVDQCIQQGI